MEVKGLKEECRYSGSRCGCFSANSYGINNENIEPCLSFFVN